MAGALKGRYILLAKNPKWFGQYWHRRRLPWVPRALFVALSGCTALSDVNFIKHQSWVFFMSNHGHSPGWENPAHPTKAVSAFESLAEVPLIATTPNLLQDQAIKRSLFRWIKAAIWMICAWAGNGRQRNMSR